MKRFFSITCVFLSSIFAFISISRDYVNEIIKADAEDASYDATETQYTEMIATYYELENNHVTIEARGESQSLVVEDSFGNTIGHIINGDRLSESTYVDSETGSVISNHYEYDEYGNLLLLNHNGSSSYTFEYNGNDLLSGAYNGNTQFWNNYDNIGNLISKMYSNDNCIEYRYDELNRLTSIIYDGNQVYSFYYNGDMSTDEYYSVVKEDNIRGTVIEYYYERGDLIRICDEFGLMYYNYNGGKLIEKNYNYFSYPHYVIYRDDTVSFGSNFVDYYYDDTDRIINKRITTDSSFELSTHIDYITYDSRPARITTNEHCCDYSYDENYNLTSTYSSLSNVRINYEYTANNQLEIEWINGNEYIYSYDERGNIVSKTLNAQEMIDVRYDNYDRLIYKFDEYIDYDCVGNPLNYKGYELMWDNGRSLSYMDNGTNEIGYAYNEEGYRISKTVNGNTTYYIYDHDNVIYEKSDDYLIYYIYGKDSELIGFKFDEGYDLEVYYYIRDGLNNIIGIVNSCGDILVTYTYDAYGNIISIGGCEAETIGEINPYRYRGYRYDIETGLYYLNSRYYDPEIGRFISSDDISMIPEYAVGVNYNLYSYAYGNPIKYLDPNGNAGLMIGGITISIGAIIILSACTAITFFGLFYPTEFNQACNVCYSAIVDFFNACKNSATSLWEKLRKSGRTNSHHIVAKAARDAEEARDVLWSVYINPTTDIRNRVNLKERFHQKLHTRWYYRSVNAVLAPYYSTSEEEVSNVLFVLKTLLSAINVIQ